MKTAVYPGSFDPITNGHLDVILRAADLFDRVIVLIGDNPSKKPLFSTQERKTLIESQLKGKKNISVDSFSGLLTDYLKEHKIDVQVRGLRALSDFENEFQRALLHQNAPHPIETVFLMTKAEHSYISSSMVREIAMFGGDVSKLVPQDVALALTKKSLKKEK